MKKLTKILWVVGVAFLLSNFASFTPTSTADDQSTISAQNDTPVMIAAKKKKRK